MFIGIDWDRVRSILGKSLKELIWYLLHGGMILIVVLFMQWLYCVFEPNLDTQIAVAAALSLSIGLGLLFLLGLLAILYFVIYIAKIFIQERGNR